jgi:IclR family acetate operon transcriptional repressor
MRLADGSAHTFKSAVRAVHILSTVEQLGRGARLAELSAALGLSKATALRTLETLVAERILRKDTHSSRYTSDHSSWAHLALFQGPARRFSMLVQQTLDDLCESTGATSSVVLPLLGRREVSTVMWSAPRVAACYDPGRAPDIAPMHAPAAGKCYLAALPQEALARYLELPLARRTERTITSPSKLRRELAGVRRQGYALNRGEVSKGACAIAVPLRRADGTVAGGLALTVPRCALPEEEAQSLVPPLESAAACISALMSSESWLRFAAETPSGPPQLPSPWGGTDSASAADSVPPVRTVLRMVRLMAYLLTHPRGASLAELVEARGLRKSTTWRLLNSLVASECVCQDPPDHRYRVDPLFWLRRADLLRSAGSLADATRVALQELADETGVTATLGLPDRDERHAVTYQFALPDSPLCWRAQHSSPSPLHATAAGKVLLAAQRRLTVQDYIRRGLEAVTDNTITSPEQLLRELESVGRKGYALSQGEWDHGASALSVPVTDSTGAVVAAVTTIRLVSALAAADVRQQLPRLRRTADRISHLLVGDWREQLERADLGS